MRRCSLMIGVLGLIGGMLSIGMSAALAQCDPVELDKLIAYDGGESDLYGPSVAIDGDVAVVGVWVDDEMGLNNGAAYVFRHVDNVWIQEQKLLPPSQGHFGYMGRSVSVDSDVIAVGRPGEGDQGSVMIFRHDGASWVFEAQLTSSDGDQRDGFGCDVALDGDRLAIGCWWDDDLGFDSGAAYVFEYSEGGWSQEHKLLAADGEAFDWFGQTVALSGDTIIVGSPYDADAGHKTGAAYVFTYADEVWSQEAKLVPTDATAGNEFGMDAALDGDVAIVGGWLDDDNGPNAGAAYVFRRGGGEWTEEWKLTASDGAENDNFGYAVTLDGDYIVVGALLDDDNGTSSGSAYAYHFDGVAWNEELKLLASDGAQLDYFGCRVALSGSTAAIGAWSVTDQDITCNVGYLLGGLSDCNDNDVLDACDITSGSSLDMNNDGIPDECVLLMGDLNCDGAIDFDDIDAFVLALVDAPAYAEVHPQCNMLRGDFDNDGDVDVDDVNPFVDRLMTR